MSSIDQSGRRLPPYSEEAERGVLGSILTDSERVYEVCVGKNLNSDAFYIPGHRLLFEEIVNMRRENRVIDLLTTGERLKRGGRLDQAGGYNFLEGLIDSTPTSAHAEYYVDIILQKAAERQWITAMAEGIDMIYSGQFDEVSAFIMEKDDTISKMLNADQLQTDSIRVSADQLEESIGLKAPVIRKIKSGINTISNRVLGYACGKITVIAARPSKGKTSMACSEGLAMALKGNKVSILTLEMSAVEYTARIACIHAQIPVEDYIDGKLSDQQREQLRLGIQQVGQLPIRINAKGMNFKQVREWARKEAKRSDILMLDLFTKIRRAGGKKFSNDQAEWSYMARVLSDDIKALDIPLILMHQIHRLNEWGGKDKNPAPKLSDLKDTGALEEEAYMVILLHDMPVDKDDSSKGNYMAIIAKHRNGWSGTCPVMFVPEFAQFKGLY
jgi:replicative DNA helicase